MQFKPLSLEELGPWEEWLDYLNSECIVPTNYLCKAFSEEAQALVLQTNKKNSQNIPYVNVQAHLSKRYINEAWIWAQTLNPYLPSQKITELCPGASLVIDLALSYLSFDKSFEKIDYQIWKGPQEHSIKKPYQQTFRELNVIAHTDSITQTDVMILNHSVDDLYMGLWNERHDGKYWEEFTDYEKVDSAWERAMPERDLYLPKLKTFFNSAAARLRPGGWLILRDYPSAYETDRKHLSRINFTKGLTFTLVQDLLYNGMTLHRPQLASAYHPLVQESFYCLRRSNPFYKV